MYRVIVSPCWVGCSCIWNWRVFCIWALVFVRIGTFTLRLRVFPFVSVVGVVWFVVVIPQGWQVKVLVLDSCVIWHAVWWFGCVSVGLFSRRLVSDGSDIIMLLRI